MRRTLLAILFSVPAAAFAQPATLGNCPGGDGPDAVECVIAAVNAALPAGCEAIDFKAMGKRIKDTPHIGLFAKMRLGLRAKGMMGDARDYDKEPSEQKLAKLKRDYDKLFSDFVSKLDGKDPDLVREMTCARGSGFDVLLLHARRENAKERDENNR